MQSAPSLLATLLPALLERAPLTPEKVDFAWQATVGAAMARSTTVRLLDSGTLVVRTEDPHWAREIERADEVILSRLRGLLGQSIVRRLLVADR
jgi:predicted nucleic acid-binding Zn ribbon protein